MIRDLATTNYTFYATGGTADLIEGLDLDVEVNRVSRRLAAHPNVLDVILDGTVDAVVNTVTGDREVLQDGFHIRRAAVDVRIPCFTSLDTARAAVESMAGNGVEYNIKPMSEYLAGPSSKR
jgi:carbamoyl-phosphate synthase large subunit